MRNLNFSFILACCLLSFGLFAQPEAGMPTEPGKCYAKCIIADQYETVTEQVLVREASSRVTVANARYEKASAQALSREAGTTLSVVPAKFEKTTEQVLAQDAARRLTISPAKFETMSEQVIKEINAPGVSVVPAKFETVTEQVLVQDAYTELRVVPAKFETVSEQVVTRPAYTVLKVVPAVYETVSEQVLDQDAYTTLSIAPAITDLDGLRDMIAKNGSSYSKGGVTRSFTTDEISNLKSVLSGNVTRLTKDEYGNVYAVVTEQVLERPAYSTYSTNAAKYETITEQELIKEAGTRIERVPAQFETVKESILTSPATTKWEKRKTDANCLSANPDDCLVWCLVEVPAQYKEVTKQVRKSCGAGYTASGDDCIRTVEVPAEYASRSYQKLAQPAGSNKTDVAARYVTRSYNKLLIGAGTNSTTVTAKYSTRTYRKVATPAKTVSETVPASYSTRTYSKLVSPATTTVVEVPAKFSTRTYQKLVTDATTTEVACGKSSILQGINFRSGSAELLSSSNTEIERLATMLKGNSAITARLVGHTDTDGSEESNITLSTNRAKAVYDALIGKGIAAARLSFDGKGESSPIATNATDAGKLQNRRTEFIVFGDNSGQGDCTLYSTRTYQKLSSDAAASTTDIAARYETRSFDRLTSDATIVSTDVPAQYTTRTFDKLAAPASTTTTDIPAQYNTVTKRNLVKAGGFTDWREVVCDTDVTPALVRRVQEALMAKGYALPQYGADNNLGEETKAALVKFQRENNLPIGQLDIETLKALGVKR